MLCQTTVGVRTISDGAVIAGAGAGITGAGAVVAGAGAVTAGAGTARRTDIKSTSEGQRSDFRPYNRGSLAGCRRGGGEERQEGVGEEAGALAEAAEAARAAEARAVASAGLLRRENRSAMVLLDEKQLQVQRLEVGRCPSTTLHLTPLTPAASVACALRKPVLLQGPAPGGAARSVRRCFFSEFRPHASLSRRMSRSRQFRSCILWGTGWSGEGPSMVAVVTTEAHVAERPRLATDPPCQPVPRSQQVQAEGPSCYD